MKGDGEIVARVTGLPLPAGAAFSLAGVMIRANLSPTSAHATMMTTSDRKAKFRRRLTDGDTTVSTGPGQGTAPPLPLWLRVTRQGDVFTAYISTDGTWGAPVVPPETVVMPADVHVGLVLLRNGATAWTTTASFANVSVLP
jgi:hypothetical protein